MYITYVLTISSLQTNRDTFANNVDPDGTAHNQPSHLDLHCLPFCFFFFLLFFFFFFLKFLFSIMDVSKSRGGRVLFQILWCERVKVDNFVKSTML